ncbi:MAG: PHP domain-containing protein, partial [Microbacteriaceae bacterium]
MLDGAARIDELIAEAVRLEMPAIAITDHGTMFGAFEFWKKATKAGIKPIIGLEAYVAPEGRFHKKPVRWGDGGEDDTSGAGAYTHMTLLAETTEGMHNLFKLSSAGYLEGYYQKPRLDREILAELGGGLIATTGCASGEVQTRIRRGEYDLALQAAAEMRDILGRDNYFVEIMDHGIDIEKRAMMDLLQLAKDLDIPLIASNDLHYTHSHDAASHDAVLCVQTGSKLEDVQRFKFGSNEFYLKSAQQMRSLFRDLPEACDNTLLIAERCDVTFDTGANYMPRFPAPEGETEDSLFVREVWEGLERRYPKGVNDEVKARAEYEIGVITDKGFPGYYLVVADFIRWARTNGIRVGPGRGSGAGSIAAYAM